MSGYKPQFGPIEITEPNPLLIKYCHKEHNVLRGCNTLMLGTLHSFREIEQSNLKDESEGLIDFRVKFSKPTTVSAKWANAWRSFEQTGFTSDGFQIVGNGELATLGFAYTHAVANSWIFCFSKSVVGGAQGSAQDEYEDSWRIQLSQLKPFASHVADLLRQQLTASDLPSELIASTSLKEILQNISIEWLTAPVAYFNKSRTFVDPDTNDYKSVGQLLETIPFCKPASFIDEQEFRVVFKLMYNGLHIPVPKNPKLVKLRPFDVVLEESEIAYEDAVAFPCFSRTEVSDQ